MKNKTLKQVKMHNLLVCACKFQDFAQSLKKIAQSHDRETVTFRNSVYIVMGQIQIFGQTGPETNLNHLYRSVRNCYCSEYFAILGASF